MKYYFIILFVLIFLPIILFAQNDFLADTTKSIYGKIPTLKEYSISSSSLTSGDTSWYKLNDKVVDEKTYKRFTQFSENINKCRPCILLSYDTSENLLFKRISYGDCSVGYWIEYYPTGGVKVIGHFKENSSGNWENIFNRGYCRQDGTWTYFDKIGNRTKSEIWKDGKLLKKSERKNVK